MRAGSTAVNADGCQTGARTRNCTGLSSLTERAHRWKCFAGYETGVPGRLRSGDLLHERQACWLDYTTGTEMVRQKESRLRPGACDAPALLTELRPRKNGGRSLRTATGVLPSLPLACHANWPCASTSAGELHSQQNGAGERNRTVVSALARPHSAVEPHPQKQNAEGRMKNAE